MALQTLRTSFSIAKHLFKKHSYSFQLFSKRSPNQYLKRQTQCASCGSFHTTSQRNDLMEFFDDRKTWGETEVKCGRPWTKDELRIKSNQDLHKLWYVLLKERNMLMTMEAEYTREAELFPNPERLDKVDVSMEHLLEVVAERNLAYNLLQTGETGEPKVVTVRNMLGLKYKRVQKEHMKPMHLNRYYRLMHSKYEPWMGKWINLYFEKKRKERNTRNKKEKVMKRILKRKFPHLTEEELKLGVEQERERMQGACKIG